MSYYYINDFGQIKRATDDEITTNARKSASNYFKTLEIAERAQPERYLIDRLKKNAVSQNFSVFLVGDEWWLVFNHSLFVYKNELELQKALLNANTALLAKYVEVSIEKIDCYLKFKGESQIAIAS